MAANNNTGLQFTLLAADRIRAKENYSLELKLAGSQSLLFLPLADTTRVTLESDWPHPEFIGQFLPVERIMNNGINIARLRIPTNRSFSVARLRVNRSEAFIHQSSKRIRPLKRDFLVLTGNNQGKIRPDSGHHGAFTLPDDARINLKLTRKHHTPL